MNMVGVNIDELPHMYELSWRANINVYPVKMDGVNKYVVLYDDHRTLLNVLYFARMKGLLEAAPNLIYFDYHDDAATIPFKRKLSAHKPRTFTKEEFEKFWNFVEFRLRTDDADWLCAGMYFDLIRDAVCVGAEETGNIDELNDYFRKSGSHHLYRINHLDFELGVRGCFEDRHSQHPQKDMQVRNIFKRNWDTDVNDMVDVPYVLDFDLDCFTGEIDDTTMAWPEHIFCNRYCSDKDTWMLLRSLMKNAAFITICREPGCCGGIGEAHKILAHLDKHFFEGQLHTMPIR
jgi:hypothetical protein